ncbi:MAG: hypothetical protein KF843_12180 [Flavobacteriales bacterium]|nr:hypothetical protein [Flavobacteriales bacterium]
MASAHRTRWYILTLVLLLIGVVVLFGPDLLARIIRDRSVHIMEQAAGPRSRIVIGNVGIELLPGDITWSELRIEQRIDSADTSWTYGRQVLIAGSVDRIAVKGLSIWKLLMRKTIDVQTLAIHGADLQLITSDRAAQDMDADQSEDEAKNLVNSIRLDSLRVDNSSLQWRNVRPDRPSAELQQLDLHARGLRAELPHGKHPFTLTFSFARAKLDSIHASLPPLYDLRVARLEVGHPDSMLFMSNIALTSQKGPHEYGQVLPFETDLTTFTSDFIGFRGLDLAALLNEHSLRAGELRISGTDLHDFRDKTMRDAPFKHKPMPARLLRSSPLKVCVDSLVVERLNVEYFEKDTITSEFGKVNFTNINSVAHGICTEHPEENPVMHLVATATIYGNAPVHFDFRTAVFDSSDHFSVKAKIGPLPFTVFNAMTNDLLLVRTTGGTIGGIDYTFEANDKRGHGRVDIEYANLKLSIAKRDGSRDKNVLKTFLANQVIRSKNLRDSGNFRHGDFTVERVQDKQIFNYMWRGLREGMMETALPGALKSAQGAMKDVKGVGKKK